MLLKQDQAGKASFYQDQIRKANCTRIRDSVFERPIFASFEAKSHLVAKKKLKKRKEKKREFIVKRSFGHYCGLRNQLGSLAYGI